MASNNHAYDESCWEPRLGLSYEVCCKPYVLRGNPKCWQSPAYTFERCCVPVSVSTATVLDVGISIPRTRALESARQRLAKLDDCSGRRQRTNFKEMERISLRNDSEAEFSWRQPWACPPFLEAVSTGRDHHQSHDSCLHPEVDEEALYLSVHEINFLAVTFAQTVPSDEKLVPLLTRAVRLAASLQELYCLARWWNCFGQRKGVIECMWGTLCLLAEIYILQMASLLGSYGKIHKDGVEISLGGGPVCNRMPDKDLAGVIQALTSFLSEVLSKPLQSRWGVNRWPELSDLSSDLGTPMTGSTLVSFQGGPGCEKLFHYSAALEFNPACEWIGLRPSGPFFAGEGYSVGTDSSGLLSWHLSIWEISESLLAMGSEEWVIINLGAFDGGCHKHGTQYWMYDPANCLLELNRKAGGVLIEGSPPNHTALRLQYSDRANVLCVEDYVQPETVARVVLDAKPCHSTGSGNETDVVRSRLKAGNIDLLKIDVDFGDCDFLEALVPKFRPKYVHAEFVPHYPPPFAFRQHYAPDISDRPETHPSVNPGNGGPENWMRGCSLTGLAQALRKNGGKYVLLQVEFDHALFVRADIADEFVPNWPRSKNLSLWDHWLAGCHCSPVRDLNRPDGRNSGFDFRMLLPPGFAEGRPDALNYSEALLRTFLTSSGGVEMPADFVQYAASSFSGKFPFSMDRCMECG